MKKRKRNVTDDVGIDEQGRPFMIGEEAGREQSRIIEHPDAKPILVIAEAQRRARHPRLWTTV
jgi:hypothetical protein